MSHEPSLVAGSRPAPAPTSVFRYDPYQIHSCYVVEEKASVDEEWGEGRPDVQRALHGDEVEDLWMTTLGCPDVVPYVRTLHEHALGGRVSFKAYPEEEFHVPAPATPKEKMRRLFFGQLPYHVTDMQLQWLCFTFGDECLVHHPERIIKQGFDDEVQKSCGKRPTGCVHAYCALEAEERVIRGVNGRILIDDTGVWYADNEREARALRDYCSTLRGNPELRTLNRPHDAVVVQVANSNFKKSKGSRHSRKKHQSKESVDTAVGAPTADNLAAWSGAPVLDKRKCESVDGSTTQSVVSVATHHTVFSVGRGSERSSCSWEQYRQSPPPPPPPPGPGTQHYEQALFQHQLEQMHQTQFPSVTYQQQQQQQSWSISQLEQLEIVAEFWRSGELFAGMQPVLSGETRDAVENATPHVQLEVLYDLLSCSEGASSTMTTPRSVGYDGATPRLPPSPLSTEFEQSDEQNQRSWSGDERGLVVANPSRKSVGEKERRVAQAWQNLKESVLFRVPCQKKPKQSAYTFPQAWQLFRQSRGCEAPSKKTGGWPWEAPSTSIQLGEAEAEYLKELFRLPGEDRSQSQKRRLE